MMLSPRKSVVKCYAELGESSVKFPAIKTISHIIKNKVQNISSTCVMDHRNFQYHQKEIHLIFHVYSNIQSVRFSF